MSKVILINGSGLGITHHAKLLEAEYRRQGIACRRCQTGRRLDPGTIKTINSFTGYVIIETNQATIEGITPWQTIEVSGGRQ